MSWAKVVIYLINTWLPEVITFQSFQWYALRESFHRFECAEQIASFKTTKIALVQKKNCGDTVRAGNDELSLHFERKRLDHCFRSINLQNDSVK